MDANVAVPAALIADPARAAILMALMDGRAHPASTLAYAANLSPTAASNHLALTDQIVHREMDIGEGVPKLPPEWLESGRSAMHLVGTGDAVDRRIGVDCVRIKGLAKEQDCFAMRIDARFWKANVRCQ